MNYLKKCALKIMFPLVIFFLIIFLHQAHVFAAANRQYEPIVVTGDLLANFLTSNTANLVVYSYNASSDTWTITASQVDEKGDDDKFLFSGQNYILSSKDELVFLDQQRGDRAPANKWISDVSSRAYPRYEIKVTDPYYGNSGYFYVYRTGNPGAHPVTTDMINANASLDDITSSFYSLGFESNKGLMSNVYIPATGGGTNVDFLERMKLRLNGTVDLSIVGGIGSMDIKINEQDHLKKDGIPEFVDGKVRVLRNWKAKFEYKINLGLTSITYPIPFTLIFKFYPNSSTMVMPKTIVLPNGFSASLFRLSFDLNSNANQMKMFASTEGFLDTWPNGELIEASNYTGVPRLFLPRYGWNWWMQTGNQGTLLTQMLISNVGNNQYLYYIDAVSGSNDGTPDTGDKKSWGDTGVKYVNNISPGDTLNFGLNFYFAGANLPVDSAEVFRQYSMQPLSITSDVQSYDVTPPATVADLRVSNVNNNSVTLAWTTPGDDGAGGGQAKFYILKYSTNAPDDDINAWWRDAINVNSLPVPGTPGATQTITISGLNPSQTYYFRMRTGDEVPNWAGLSNVATTITTPVELAGFTATQQERYVTVSWRTVSETNNLGFEVERCATADAGWSKLAFIKGAGTTTTTQKYSFRDEPQSSGVIKYRLRQIDTDGTATLSAEVAITIAAPQKFVLHQNYPNPFNPNTWIDFEIPENSGNNTELSVYDLLGRKVRVLLSGTVAPGYHKIEWDGFDDNNREVASGAYFYMLVTGENKAICKMLKMK